MRTPPCCRGTWAATAWVRTGTRPTTLAATSVATVRRPAPVASVGPRAARTRARAPVGEGGHEHSVDRGGPLQYVHDGGDGLGRLDVDVPAHGWPGRQQLLQKRELAAVGQLGLPYLRPGHLGQQARTAGHPVERRVVQGHRDAVGRCSDVCLHDSRNQDETACSKAAQLFSGASADPPRWAKAIGPSWSRKGKAVAIAPQRYRGAAGSHTPKLR